MNTDEVMRSKFELIVKDSKVHNNQMLKRHALDAEKYQYDSVQFAFECYQQATKDKQAEIERLKDELRFAGNSLEGVVNYFKGPTILKGHNELIEFAKRRSLAAYKYS
jgi:hypothetical protein